MNIYRLIQKFYREKTRINKHHIPLEPLRGLRILHISDIHGNTEVLEQIHDLLEAQGLTYHMLLITGDLLNRIGQLEKVTESLLKISRKASVISAFVPGNNEKYRKKKTYYPAIVENLSQIDIQTLCNRAVRIPYNNQTVFLCGVDDLMEGCPDVLRMLKHHVAGKSHSILLCHVPTICFSPLFTHFALVLSGHTHGGQISLPLLGPCYLNSSALPLKFSAGMHRLNSTYFNISRGIGTSTIHFRLNNPPEATWIDLT